MAGWCDFWLANDRFQYRAAVP